MPIVPMTGKPEDSLYPEPEEQKIEINPLSYLNTPDTATEAEFAVAVDELAKMSPFGIRETGDYSQFGADNAKDAFFNLRKATLHGIESLSDDESRAWFETDPEDIETRYRIASDNLPPSQRASLFAGEVVGGIDDMPILSEAEYKVAPPEVREASDRLKVQSGQATDVEAAWDRRPGRDKMRGDFPTITPGFASWDTPPPLPDDADFSGIISQWRDRYNKERTISAYSARIDAKNTLRKWAMMRPILSDDADSLLQHIMADKPRDDEFDAKFMALPEEQQEVVMMLGRDLRNTPDKNMLRDSMTEFMNGGMRLFGDAAKEVHDLWMMAETDREDFQKQAEVKARMQELWAPKRSQEYGYWEDAIIGTIGSLPYTGFTMATAVAGVPEVGLGVISLSMAHQFKRQIALQGGDVTDPKVLVMAQAAGIAYWGIEQAQVGTWMKSMTDLERRMATSTFAKSLIPSIYKAEARAKMRQVAPKIARDFTSDLLKEWLYEEQTQDLIESGFVSWGAGEDVARSMAEQAIESLHQNFGTMLLMTGGFSAIGAARTGLSRKHTDQELFDAMHHRAQLTGSLHQRNELREKVRKGEDIDRRQLAKLEKDIDYQRRVLSTFHRAFNKAGGMEDAESAFQRMGLDPRQSFLAAYMFDQERRSIMGDPDLTQAEKEELIGKQATSLSLLKQAYPNRTFTENPDGTFTSSYTINGNEVREIHQTGTLELDPASPEGATSTVNAINAAEKAARLSGAPFSDNMKGMTEERWLDLTPEARNEIVQALDLRPEGNFIFTAKMAGSPDVAQVDEKQIRHLSGEITLAPDADQTAAFHEDLHAFVRYLRETGDLTPQDVQKLREEFGDPRKGVNEDFNEEAAAETIRKMQSRSVRHIESTGAEAIMDKVFDALDRIDLFRRRRKQAETVAENLLGQMRRGEWAGIPVGTITEAQRQKNAQLRQKAKSKPKKQAKKPQEPAAKKPEQAQEPSDAEIQPEGQDAEKPPSGEAVAGQGELNALAAELRTIHPDMDDVGKRFTDEFVQDVYDAKDEAEMDRAIRDLVAQYPNAGPSLVGRLRQITLNRINSKKQDAEEAAAAAEADEIGAGETSEVDADQPLGKGEWRAVTPHGNVEAEGEWEVRDLFDLITSWDTGYNITQFQGRDAGTGNKTAESLEKIDTVARNPDVNRMGESSYTSGASPMWSPRGEVIVRNHLTESLRKAVKSYPDQWAKVEKWTRRMAADKGIVIPENIKFPVIGRRIDRILTPGATMKDIADLSNIQDQTPMGENERAWNDGAAIRDKNLLRFFRPSDTGNLNAPSNAEFITQFIRARNASDIIDKPTRMLTDSGSDRIKMALLGLILGESMEARNTINSLLTSEAKGVRTQINGILKAVPVLVSVTQTHPAYDLADILAITLHEFITAKNNNESPFQGVLIPRPPAVDALLQALYTRTRAADIHDIFTEYAARVRKIDAETGKLMDIPDSTKEELLSAAIEATKPVLKPGEQAGDADETAEAEKRKPRPTPTDRQKAEAIRGQPARTDLDQMKQAVAEGNIPEPRSYDEKAAGSTAQADGQGIMVDEEKYNRETPMLPLSTPEQFKTRDGKPDAKKVSAFLPYMLSGNKSEIGAKHAHFFVAIVDGAPVVFDMFGGAGTYTFLLSRLGALPKGSTLNEWEYSRHITLKHIQQNPAAVIEALDSLSDRFEQAVAPGDRKGDDIANTRQDILDWFNAELRGEHGTEYVPETAIAQDGRFVLIDSPQTAALYLFAQNSSVQNRALDPVMADGKAAWGLDGKPIGRDLLSIIQPDGTWKYSFRLADAERVITEASALMKDVNITQRDGWELALEAPAGAVVFIDSSYFNKAGGKTMNYGGSTQIDADPEVWIKKVERLAQRKDVTYVITNNWNDYYVSRLEALGFLVAQSSRAGEERELIALSGRALSIVARPQRTVDPNGYPLGQEVQPGGSGTPADGAVGGPATGTEGQNDSETRRPGESAEGPGGPDRLGDQARLSVQPHPTFETSITDLEELYRKQAKRELGYTNDEYLEWKDEYYARESRFIPGMYYRVSGGMESGNDLGAGVGDGLYIGRDSVALNNFYGHAIGDAAELVEYRLANNGRQIKWLDATKPGELDKMTKKAAKKYQPKRGKKDTDSLPQYVTDLGYDGIRYYDPAATGEEFVLYKPELLVDTKTGKPRFSVSANGRKALTTGVYKQQSSEVLADLARLPASLKPYVAKYDDADELINLSGFAGWKPGPKVAPPHIWPYRPAVRLADGSIAWHPRARMHSEALSMWLKQQDIPLDAFDIDEYYGDGGLGPDGRYYEKAYIGDGVSDFVEGRETGRFSVQARQPAPAFYSQLRRVIEAKVPNRATVAQIRATIDPSKGSGVKADEIFWSGLEEFLDARKPADMVTKEEVLAATREVVVTDVVKEETPEQEALQKELSDLARLGSDRTYEQDTRYEYLARRLNHDKEYGGKPKFNAYQLPGGENYRELLLTLPPRDYMSRLKAFADERGISNIQEAERQYKLTEEGMYPDAQPSDFRSGHFSEPNIVAHVRFNERTSVDGKRTLFIEEIQSDWAQKGREDGFAGQRPMSFDEWLKDNGVGEPTQADRTRYETYLKLGDPVTGFSAVTKGVPPAPYVTKTDAWVSLTLKRMVRWAAENGFEQVAWTTGEQQAERYDLSKQIGELAYWKDGDNYGLSALDPSGRVISSIDQLSVKQSELENTVGKEIAKRIIDDTGDSESQMGFPDEPGVKYLRGPDLKVGGEGMKGFYDQIVPTTANKLFKRFGARVGEAWFDLGDPEDAVAPPPDDMVDEGGFTAHALPITPALRDSVLYEGQARFSVKAYPNLYRDVLSKHPASDKLDGNKAWLTLDGKWINVDEHRDAVPFDDGMYADIGVQEMAESGLVRVHWVDFSSMPGGVMYAEHAPGQLTRAQRKELEDTAIERGGEVEYDPGQAWIRQPPPRYSVRARAPLFGNNNRAIASLAVQHLMGEKLDTERAEKAMYLFAASGTTPDQMIADAKKLAESKVAQEAKKHIENRDPNAAHRVMSQQAEYDSIVALRTGMKSGLKMGQEAERAKQTAEKKLLLNARGEDLQQFIIDTGIDWTETLLSSLPEAFAEWEKAREEAEKKAKEDGAPEGPQQVPETPPADPAELEARDRRMREFVAAVRAWGDAERAKREKEADDRRKKEQERIEKGESGEEADDTDADPGGEQAEGMEPEGLAIPKELLQAHGVDIRNAQEVAHLIRIWMADWLVRQSKGRLTHQTVWKDREAVEKYRKTMVSQLRDMANGMVEQGWSMTVIHNRISDIPSTARPDTIERRTASIVAMIQAHSIRQTRAQLITDIRKNITKKAIKGKRHDALNEDLEGKINSEQELTARYLRRILTWSPEKVDAEIVAIQARLKERTELYSEQNPDAKVALDVEFHRDLMRLRVLKEWGGLKRMLPAQIKQAGIAIDGWLVSAQERLYRRWWAMEEQIGKLVTALNEGIVPDDPEQARIQVSRISGWINDNIATVRQRLEGLIRQQHDPIKRQAAQAAIDEIMFTLSRGTEIYHTVANAYRQAFVEAVNDIAGGKNAATAYMKHLEEEIPIEVAEQVSRQGYDGRGGGRVMTYNQALQLYASITQRGYASNVKLHKREEHAALLEGIFTTEDLALIVRLREIYEERRGRLSEVVQEVSGMLVWRPDPLYMPVRVKMPKKGGFQSKGDPSTWMPLARSLTPRVHHGLDFDEGATLTGTFYDATEDAARAIGFGTRGLILRGVLGNSTIQESADRYYGGGEMADMNQQVVQALDGFGRTDSDSTHGILRTIRELNAYAALSWNPMTALKQTVSFPVFAMALDGGFGQVLSAIKDFDREALRDIMESDGFKARYEGGFMPEVAEILSDGRRNPIARFYKLGMTTVQIGDFVPSLMVAPGLYKARLAQNIDAGMDEATAKERAMTWTWEMIEATQQTSRAEMLPKFYRQTGAGSEAMKLILQFSSAPLLQLSHEYHAWRDAMAGVDGAWKRLGRAVLVNHIIIPQMLEMVKKMFYWLIGRDEPEDQQLFWTIFNGATIGAVGRIMIIGILAETAYNAVVEGKIRYGGQMVPAESLTRTGAYAVRAFLHDPFDPEDGMDAFQSDIVKALEGMLAPFRYGKEFYDNRIAQ